MSQNRKPPAFQEYASTMLANRKFRLMTASQRGVFWTMRLEAWANETLPAEPSELAAILGLDAAEVAAALPAVMPFFVADNGEIRSPELDDYRAHLAGIRGKQSRGGRNGANKTNRQRQAAKEAAAEGDSATTTANPTGNPTANPQLPRRVLSKEKSKPAKSKPSSGKASTAETGADPWIADYEAAELRDESDSNGRLCGSDGAEAGCTAQSYLQASQGT